MRESLKVSLFLYYLFSYHKHYFNLYLPNIISQKLLQCALCTCQTLFLKNFLQCALCTYQMLFHKNIYSVCSVLTKHYFTKTFTVCALYLPNIISQKHSQCALCTTKHYFTKTFTVCALYLPNIISQKHYIK